MKKLPSTTTIYDLSKECSQTPEIMENLGFGPANETGMLQTSGRLMTLKKGCEQKNISYEDAKKAFREAGIEFVDEEALKD
ncbi:MAG: DUF1858 domain-containing protein [Candidatus Izemoplasmatales bacterium]